MEDQYTEPEEQYEEKDDGFEQEDAVEIYSKQAILWFSILFNTIFGGVLLMQNLRDAGYKKEANQIIIFSVLYYLLPAFLLGTAQLNTTIYFAAVLALNIVGGLILSNYFFPKYFPDSDYYPKSITRVAIRFIMISLILVLLGNYLMQAMPGLKK